MTTDAPARPAPRLKPVQLAWRWAVAAGWYVLIVVLGAALDPATGRVMFLIDFVGGAVQLVLAGFRRRAPLPLAIASLAIVPWSFSGVAAAMWILVSLCTRRRFKEIAIAVAVSLSSQAVSVFVNVLLGPQPPVPNPPEANEVSTWLALLVAGAFWVMMLGIAIGIGLYTGARRDLIASLEERAEQAVREQELRVAQGQAAERQRIAREMHDVLAHRISLVSLHAGTLAYRSDLGPEQTREIASVIRENAHASLNELRSVLGSLRGDGQVDKPQPTLAQLPVLLAEVTDAGMNVDQFGDADLTAVSPISSRHAFRIVQEALTNARKHAPHAHVMLSLNGDATRGLSIEVANPLGVGGEHIPGAGFGLVGLRERAAVAGGRIEAGVSDSQFKVTAWLPW